MTEPYDTNKCECVAGYVTEINHLKHLNAALRQRLSAYHILRQELLDAIGEGLLDEWDDPSITQQLGIIANLYDSNNE